MRRGDNERRRRKSKDELATHFQDMGGTRRHSHGVLRAPLMSCDLCPPSPTFTAAPGEDEPRSCAYTREGGERRNAGEGRAKMNSRRSFKTWAAHGGTLMESSVRRPCLVIFALLRRRSQLPPGERTSLASARGAGHDDPRAHSHPGGGSPEERGAVLGSERHGQELRRVPERVVPAEVRPRLEPGVRVLPKVPVLPAGAAAEAVHPAVVVLLAPGPGPPAVAVRGPGLPLPARAIVAREIAAAVSPPPLECAARRGRHRGRCPRPAVRARVRSSSRPPPSCAPPTCRPRTSAAPRPPPGRAPPTCPST